MTTRGPDQVSGSFLWGAVLVAATTAAVAAWLLGESGVLRVVPERTDVMLMGVKLRDVTPETVRSAELRSAIIAFASFGGALGLATGVAGGLAGRAPRKGAVAGLVGLVAGSTAGALAAVGASTLHHGMVAGGMSESLTGLVTHATIWVAIGAASGLALGVGLGGRGSVVRAVAGASTGALLGAVIFDVIGALAFPLDETNGLISTGAASRLVARLSGSIPAAAAAVAAVAGHRRESRGQDPAGVGAVAEG